MIIFYPVIVFNFFLSRTQCVASDIELPAVFNDIVMNMIESLAVMYYQL